MQFIVRFLVTMVVMELGFEKDNYIKRFLELPENLFLIFLLFNTGVGKVCLVSFVETALSMIALEI